MKDASTVLTKKLYDEDAYRQRFTAKVISLNKNDLLLEETAFFPEEGGQSCDRGEIEGFAVVDVQIRDGLIHHFLNIPKEAQQDAEAIFAEGKSVTGQIDFALRYSNMQQHSGEHIFSGLVHKYTGYDNIGFHLSDSGMTVDFGGPIDDELLAKIEREANQAIFENVPSQVVFLRTQAERESMDYRSKLALTDAVRVVIFANYDACACCAPHVRSTAEIGMIKVVGKMNWKGGVRLSLLCGQRAFALLASEHQILTKTASYLSASVDDVYALTVKMKEEQLSLKHALQESQKQLLRAKAQANGNEHLLLFEEGADMKAAREVVTERMAKGGISAIFIGSDGKGWSYVIGSSVFDCRIIGAKLRERLNAKGGGKPEMIQGSTAASQEALTALLSEIIAESEK